MGEEGGIPQAGERRSGRRAGAFRAVQGRWPGCNTCYQPQLYLRPLRYCLMCTTGPGLAVCGAPRESGSLLEANLELGGGMWALRVGACVPTKLCHSEQEWRRLPAPAEVAFPWCTSRPLPLLSHLS